MSWLIVCPYTSLHCVCESLLDWIPVWMLSYFVTNCTCICLSLDACFSLNIRSSVSHSLSVWMPLSVFGYVVIDCTCIGTSLDPRFSLSFSLCVSAVSDYIMTDCRCKCTPLDSCFWLFFSECFYPCSAILTLILLTCIGTSLDPLLSLYFSVCVSVRVHYP